MTRAGQLWLQAVDTPRDLGGIGQSGTYMYPACTLPASDLHLSALPPSTMDSCQHMSHEAAPTYRAMCLLYLIGSDGDEFARRRHLTIRAPVVQHSSDVSGSRLGQSHEDTALLDNSELCHHVLKPFPLQKPKHRRVL